MAAMGMPIAVYLPRFYSEGMGLSLVTVGTIFTIARIWDVFTDPIMGTLIDKIDTRWGRRRHWIALSIPILVVSVWMVFLPDREQVTGTYLLFWLIMLYIGYTMMAITHQSWGAELSKTYDDRSRLFGWREIFVIAGMTIVLAIPAAMELSGHSDQSSKVGSMGWFCLILFPLLAVPTLLWVPDTHTRPGIVVPWREAVRMLVANKLMWRLLLADLAAGFGIGVSGALYIFVASTYFKLPEHASIALLFYFLAGFIAMPLWLKLAYRVGKDNAMKIALLYMTVINLALIPLAEEGNVIVLWSFTILYGAAFGAPPTLIRSMMADLTDDDELRSGQARPGLFFALLTTTNKLGAAFAVGISFWTLELAFKFVPRADNTPEALEGLLITYCAGTALGLFIALLPLIGYPLTRTVHADIRRRLDERAASTVV
jgi:Na+/melibiose symporter-like transporter